MKILIILITFKSGLLKKFNFANQDERAGRDLRGPPPDPAERIHANAFWKHDYFQ